MPVPAASRLIIEEIRVVNFMEKGGSAGWPIEFATAKQMDVQMRHGLAAVTAVVNDQPVAGLRDALVPGDLCGREQQVAKQDFIR